ncbi:hypothetical protein FOZ63_007886 [Perkinsus olseni]|uniref:Uncharacterized protein n=1 Tax=Perkinsus olseni TaxID=32597 RepID=A0A7J6PX86_PEROL|nr:hypothetical protein FOZ63_007886 [Perkinsus olseni]
MLTGIIMAHLRVALPDVPALMGLPTDPGWSEVLKSKSSQRGLGGSLPLGDGSFGQCWVERRLIVVAEICLYHEH